MFLTVGGLFETLATFLPLPCTVLFLNLARGNQHIQSILARIRAYNQQYIFVVDHVQAALLQGVWCPGLDSIASGMLLFDRGQRPLHAAILDRFGLSAEHAVDLRPLVRGFSLQNDATPMVAWHCGNRFTPAWISLAAFLADNRVHLGEFLYMQLPPPQSSYFIVPFLYGTLRGPLVFSSPPYIEVDDSD